MTFVATTEFRELLATIAQEVGGAAKNYALSRGVLGAVIRLGEEQGLSGRAILSAYRAAGGKTADSTFWALRRQIQQAVNPLGGTIGRLQGVAESIQNIKGGREGTYRVDFTVYQRIIGPDGTVTEVAVPRTVVQKGGLDVQGAMEEMSARENRYPSDLGNVSVQGFEVTGLYRYVG